MVKRIVKHVQGPNTGQPLPVKYGPTRANPWSWSNTGKTRSNIGRNGPKIGTKWAKDRYEKGPTRRRTGQANGQITGPSLHRSEVYTAPSTHALLGSVVKHGSNGQTRVKTAKYRSKKGPPRVRASAGPRTAEARPARLWARAYPPPVTPPTTTTVALPTADGLPVRRGGPKRAAGPLLSRPVLGQFRPVLDQTLTSL
jgi:hypothetical protein